MVTKTVKPSNKLTKSKENISRGLLFALAAVAIGIIAYVLLAQFGFLSAMTTYLMVYLAIRLYVSGSGSLPLKGFYLFIALIVLGVFMCIVGGITLDAFKYYNSQYQGSLSSTDFIMRALLLPEVWSSYAKEIAITIGFAVLGSYRTLTNVAKLRKAHYANIAKHS